MSEPTFRQLFRSRWQGIIRQFWPETPRAQLQSQLARLDAELGRRQKRLLIMRKRIEKLHYYLKRREHRLAQLAALVQIPPTDAGVSVKLQRQQRSVDHLRDRLQDREREYARRLVSLRQRKQTWAKLRERLLFGSLPPIKDESDPYYPF